LGTPLSTKNSRFLHISHIEWIPVSAGMTDGEAGDSCSATGRAGKETLAYPARTGIIVFILYICGFSFYERGYADMFKGKERRKYKRVKKPFIIGFQIKEHKGRKKAFEGWDMVAVLDIGAGGALFYYNKKVEVGSLLDLKVNFSPEEDPISCVGEVIRVEDLRAPYLFLVALIFSEITKKDRERIIRVVDECYSKWASPDLEQDEHPTL